MAIDPGGANLDYSTYLGGTGSDRTYGLAVDPDGNIILSGLTFSRIFRQKIRRRPGRARESECLRDQILCQRPVDRFTHVTAAG